MASLRCNPTSTSSPAAEVRAGNDGSMGGCCEAFTLPDIPGGQSVRRAKRSDGLIGYRLRCSYNVFTVVELMVTLSIIAILMALIVPAVPAARRNFRRKADCARVRFRRE